MFFFFYSFYKVIHVNHIFNHYSTLSFQFARRFISNKFEKFADSKVVFMLWSTMKPCLTLHYCKWWNQDCIYDINTVLFWYVLRHNLYEPNEEFYTPIDIFLDIKLNTNHLVPFFVFYYIIYQSKYVVFCFFVFFFF